MLFVLRDRNGRGRREQVMWMSEGTVDLCRSSGSSKPLVVSLGQKYKSLVLGQCRWWSCSMLVQLLIFHGHGLQLVSSDSEYWTTLCKQWNLADVPSYFTLSYQGAVLNRHIADHRASGVLASWDSALAAGYHACQHLCMFAVVLLGCSAQILFSVDCGVSWVFVTLLKIHVVRSCWD